MPYKYFQCKLCCSLLQGEFHFESVVLLDLVTDVINKIILLKLNKIKLKYLPT